MRHDLFNRLARYNAWANSRIYDACGKLDEADYHARRPAFFGSLHNTLAHLLLTDRMWLGRILGEPPIDLPLDAVIIAERAELWAAREAEDARIIAVVAALTEADLDRSMSYRTSTGEPRENQLHLTLQHVFNHQTHHRGQVHDMLNATNVPPPPLDLIYFARLTAPT